MIYRLVATFEVQPNSMKIEDFNVKSITLSKIYKVDAETSEEAFNYVKEQISTFCKRHNDVLLKNHIILVNNIMSYNNGHNKQLVDKLNELWYDEKNRNNFHLILATLYTKYKEECEEKNINIYDINNKFYEDFVWDILTNVCDDVDLETIIKFVSHT